MSKDPENYSYRSNEDRLGIVLCVLILIVGGALCLFLYNCNTSINSRSRTSASAESRTYKPYQSQWDGSVNAVERWVKKNARDPKSVEFVTWSTLREVKYNEWEITCKWRARNAYGGMVINEGKFKLDDKGGCVPISLNSY